MAARRRLSRPALEHVVASKPQPQVSPLGENLSPVGARDIPARPYASKYEEIKMQNLIPQGNGSALAHLAAVAATAQEMHFLKFVKGEFYSGDDEVPLGTEYIAHVDQLVCGRVKFADGKVVDQRIGLIAEGFKPPPRKELGDLDESKWEKDGAGMPRDPWTLQYFLPIEGPETGELLTYVTGSRGGISAIGRLCNQFVRKARNGLPIVRLSAGSYKHKRFGRVEKPDFPVVSWTGASVAGVEQSPNASEKEVPF